MIGEAFPGLSDFCGMYFYVENTCFLVSGSMARKIKKKHSKVSVSSYSFTQQSGRAMATTLSLIVTCS